MRLPEIFMPTEFLHGLYDGGHGAGLYDYWEMMRRHPRCAGGFLWMLADEGVKRVDMNGFIDKEGSYYTIRQVWCPIQIMNTPNGNFDGVLQLENRYDFSNLKDCKFKYEYVAVDGLETKVIKSATVNGPDIEPHTAGTLKIASVLNNANLLHVTAIDAYGSELFTWTYNLVNVALPVLAKQGAAPTYTSTAEQLKVSVADKEFTFSYADGQLKGVKLGGSTFSLSNGPRFIAAKRADRSMDQFYNHDDKDAEKKKTQYTTFEDAGRFTGFDIKSEGTVELDFSYNFSGVVDLMGVMFDYPEEKMLRKSWLGKGPYRVWQNRLHGPQTGIWANDYNDPIPGESFLYPEFKGYFADVQWMELSTSEGTVRIANKNPEQYMGVYQPRDGRDELLYRLPATGIALMRVIPPVRNKVNTTDLVGPSSQACWADGQYGGGFIMQFSRAVK